MTTLSPPRAGVESDRLAALPAIPRDGAEPVFAAPWEAQAFALAVKLSDLGHFTWREWAAMLAEEIKRTEEAPESRDGSNYYHHWLAALERIAVAKGLCDSLSLQTRKAAWADAYRHTPHGQPVTLVLAPGPQTVKNPS